MKLNSAITRTLAGCFTATLATALLTFMLFADNSEAGSLAAGNKIQIGSGADRLPNESAAEWISYADYVATVTVSRERELPPSDTEIA